jgi:hypothetical protein
MNGLAMANLKYSILSDESESRALSRPSPDKKDSTLFLLTAILSVWSEPNDDIIDWELGLHLTTKVVAHLTILATSSELTSNGGVTSRTILGGMEATNCLKRQSSVAALFVKS